MKNFVRYKKNSKIGAEFDRHSVRVTGYMSKLTHWYMVKDEQHNFALVEGAQE